MKKVALADIEPFALGEGSRRWGLTEPLGATEIAFNQYQLAPGDGLPGGLHAHMDQEEVFVVLDGTATFETLDGEVTVGEFQAIRFSPGEFQSGRNDGESELTVVALGAPRDTEDIRIPVHCPDCNHNALRLEFGEGMRFLCPECTEEHNPGNCPHCGGDDLQVTVNEKTDPVVVCQDCQAQFDCPPLQD